VPDQTALNQIPLGFTGGGRRESRGSRPKHLLKLEGHLIKKIKGQLSHRERPRRLGYHSRSSCHTSPNLTSQKPVHKFLRKDAIFQNIESKCQQIACVREVAELQRRIPISIDALPTVFDCPRSRVKSKFEHGLEPLGHPGMHVAILPDPRPQVLHWTKRDAESNTSVARKKLEIILRVNSQLFARRKIS
jgi:hypothetical protein